MSLPVEQQPPPATAMQQSSAGHSIGPVIGVLTVIIVVAVLAVMVGRLCSGKKLMGYGQYDLESWAETKCSSCIDGRISSTPPRANVSVASIPTPVQTRPETKQEEHPL